MLTMAVGQSDDVDPKAAVADAIDQCRTQLGSLSPAVALLFAAHDSFEPGLPQAVREAFPGIDVIGSTSAAEMSSVAGYLEDSIALAVFASDEIEMAVGWSDEVSSDPAKAAHDAVSQALAHTTKDAQVCIVVADPLSAQLVIEALRQELSSDTLIVGGSSARPELGGDKPTYQFWNDHVASEGVAILVLAGPVVYSTAVGTGWRTLGPSGTVTRATYGRIHEIDGRPAVAWISGYLDLDVEGTFGNPLAVKDPGAEDWYLRVVLRGDESGSVAIPGGVPVGATVQLTTTNPDDMLAATTAAIQRARDNYPGQSDPSAALVFSCAVRKFLLGTRTGRELEAARAGLPEATPIAGMYCIGEIAPTGDEGRSHFLNETFVTLLLGT